jgi:hypothetical protein
VPEVVIGLVVGVAIGGGAAWLLAGAHVRARLLGDLRARESRLAAAEATVDELRKQLSQRELEAADARAALGAAQTQRAQA